MKWFKIFFQQNSIISFKWILIFIVIYRQSIAIKVPCHRIAHYVYRIKIPRTFDRIKKIAHQVKTKVSPVTPVPPSFPQECIA